MQLRTRCSFACSYIELSYIIARLAVETNGSRNFESPRGWISLGGDGTSKTLWSGSSRPRYLLSADAGSTKKHRERRRKNREMKEGPTILLITKDRFSEPTMFMKISGLTSSPVSKTLNLLTRFANVCLSRFKVTPRPRQGKHTIEA